MIQIYNNRIGLIKYLKFIIINQSINQQIEEF